MSSSGYITYPQVTDPQDLMALAFEYLKAKYPGWQPAEGNLDTWLVEAFSNEAAIIQTLATQVPSTIFRYAGSKLFGIPPVDAVAATVTSTWTAVDTIGHTIAAGTQVGIRDADGNLIPFQVTSDVIIPGGASVTATGAVTLVALTPGASPNGIGTDTGVIELIDALSWVSSIAQHLTVANGVDAETDVGYLNRLSTELQTLSPRPILAPDFAILARNVAGVQRAVAVDNYNSVHNLLTVNDASFETSVADFTDLGNCAVAQTAAQALDGTKSMSLTASSAASMNANMGASTYVAVSPGDSLAVMAYFRSAVTPRSCQVGIKFYQSDGVTVLTTPVGTAVADTTSGWTQVTALVTAPQGAARACVRLIVQSPANAEVHYVDKLQVRRSGAVVTDWVAGGTAETGNERMVTVFGLDKNGAPIDSTHKTALATYLDGLREFNFVVKTADPVQETVDVRVFCTVETGYTTSDVQTRVASALAAYLNPAIWGIAPTDDPNNPVTWINTTTIYRYNIAAVVGRVGGVKDVTSVEIGLHGGSLFTTDFTLGNIAPVPVAGTMTVVAS